MAKKEKKRSGKNYSFNHLREVPKAEKKLENPVLTAGDKTKKKEVRDPSLSYVYKDLKKVGYITLGILLVIGALYYFINYTEVLNPLLKSFKLA